MRKPLSVAVVAVALGIAGCTAPAPGGPQQCDELARVAVEPGAPTVSVVIDRTASAARTSWPAATVARVTAVARLGGTLSIVGVDGAGAPPLAVWTRHPLVPPAVRGTPREDAVIAVAVACAVQAGWDAIPTAPGSDLLGALNAAVDAVGPDRAGSAVEMVTDGYASAGALRFDTGVDPDGSPAGELAARVVADRGLADLTGTDVAVHLAPLADRPADEASRQWIEQVYRELLRLGGTRSGTVDRDTGPPAPAATGPLPADPVVLAAPQPPVVAAAPDVRRLSGNAFFEPGSAALRPGVDVELRPIAALLAPGLGRRAEVVGHVASWGPVPYREDLARERAGAIAAALVRLGADGAALTVRGAGSREPLAADLDGAGRLIPDRAAQNRRVDVLLGAL